MIRLIEQRAEHIASALRASSALVERTRRADRVSVVLVPEDDLLTRRELHRANPLQAATVELAATDPVPIGVLATGELAHLTLYQRSVLIGGSPGSGKSSLVQQVLAGAALMRDCELWLVDPKGGVELGFWRDRAMRFAITTGTDTTQAVELLRDLRDEMDRRYDELNGSGARLLRPSASAPLIVLVVEELAALMGAGDKRTREELAGLLLDVVQRGRAAAICPVLLTQFPKADILPTTIRNQLATRIALRCGRTAQSDTILGEEASHLGADASTIPTDAPGLAFMVGETDQRPYRLRAFYLSDDELRQLARVSVRVGAPAVDEGKAEASGPPPPPDLGPQPPLLAEECRQGRDLLE